MARLSINELTTFRWSFEEDVRCYAATGLEGIGVWRQKLSDYGEERGVDLLAESQLEVSCLLWAGGFTGSDGRTYRDSLEDAIEAVRLAAELRAETLVLYTGGRAGHTRSHARRLFQGALDELLPMAVDCGVTLAIEPMHAGCAGDWTYLTGSREAIDLVRSTGSPHLKLVFDAYHLGHEPELLSRLDEIVPMIGIVQLGDARQPPSGVQNRCLLGSGVLPLPQLVSGLIESGYCGFFDVELLGEDVEHVGYLEVIEASQKAFAGWKRVPVDG
jgi:sugar phosphate isomerase/epimerase